MVVPVEDFWAETPISMHNAAAARTHKNNTFLIFFKGQFDGWEAEGKRGVQTCERK